MSFLTLWRPPPRFATAYLRGPPASAYFLAMVAVAALAPHAALGCASCGCTLNSDAAMGYSALPGWRLNVEYDYIHQDELRSGTREVSTVPNGVELERETLSRYITAALSYSPNAAWNINLLVPYVERTHSPYGDFDGARPFLLRIRWRSNGARCCKQRRLVQSAVDRHAATISEIQGA